MSKAAILQRVVVVAALGGSVTLLSPGLISHLEKWESSKKRVLVVYADKLAAGIPTVCNGVTRHVTKTPIVVGELWAEEKCVAVESESIAATQMKLLPCFKRLPPPSVFDMASSHAWNFGPAATCGSGAMAAWNRGEWERGCQRISRGDDGQVVWSFVKTGRTLSGGKPEMKFVQGLANRRADETAKCSS